MKKARHVATGKIVCASEVDYKEYYGIFECPCCKAALRLRKEYTRSDGVTIGAAFIHPSEGTDEQLNCPLRLPMSFSEAELSSRGSNPSSRTQFYKLLKNKFLKCLKFQSKYGLWEYYTCYSSGSERTLKNIRIFLTITNALLKLPQNGGYVLKQEETIKDMFKSRKDIWNMEESEKYLKQDLNKVIWAIEFLMCEAEDKFRKKALNYIFGYYIREEEGESVQQMYYSENEINTVTFKESIIPLGFKMNTIKTVAKVISDKELNKLFFSQMYKGEFSEYSADFQIVKSFHNRIFEYIIQYLINFNWNSLLF